jgi:hypothetical protein
MSCTLCLENSQQLNEIGIVAQHEYLFIILQMPESYNHMNPTIVGNSMRSVVSELSGRGNILDKVSTLQMNWRCFNAFCPVMSWAHLRFHISHLSGRKSRIENRQKYGW